MASSSGFDSTTLLLGRYHVEAALGEGSFGTVVRAFDTRLKRTVAIKTLKRSLAATDMDQFRAIEERFAREAEAGSRMGIHANLVTVHDLVIEPDHTQYLILEYVRGGTLVDRMRAGALPLDEALRITADVARGLQSAHDVGVVHRDIKPANVFLATDGRAQVGDFGIAQIDDVSGRTHTTVRHPGTPLYMSPEQAQTTGYVRPASDQYSLGLVLFEMLTGKAYKRIGERAARELLAAQQIMVASLVEDMIATDPDDRLPSCAHVIRQIQLIARAQGLSETQLAVERAESGTVRGVALPPDAPSGSRGSSGPPGVIPPPDQPTRAIPTDSARPAFDRTVESGPLPTQYASSQIPVYAPPPAETAQLARSTPSVTITDTSRLPPPAVPPEAGQQSAAPAPRRRRGLLIASIAAVLLLAAGGTIGAFALWGGNPGAQVTATAQIPTPTAAAATSAPATQVPTIAAATTAAPSAVASATTPPTVPATVTPAQTAAPRTPVSAPAIAIRSVGTTDQQLDTVRGEDVKTSFTAGQDVFGFVNFGGALPGTDMVEMTLVKNGAPQQPQRFTLTRSDGFLVFPLGKLDAGDYQLIARYDGKVAKTFDFKVTPQPTATPRPPTATPRPPTFTPSPITVSPTPTPVRVVTVTPRPTIPPTQPVPTP